MLIYYTLQNGLMFVIPQLKETLSTGLCQLHFQATNTHVHLQFVRSIILVRIVSYLVLSIHNCTMLEKPLAKLMKTMQSCSMQCSITTLSIRMRNYHQNNVTIPLKRKHNKRFESSSVTYHLKMHS